MTRWHEHLKIPLRFADFLEFCSINYEKPYAKNAAYKGIQSKVTKL